MKNMIAGCLMLFSGFVFAYPDDTTYTLTIENSEATVSPSGSLRFKLVGSKDQDTTFVFISIRFETDIEGIVSRETAPRVGWHYDKNTTHPRYAELFLPASIDGTLPKTAKLSAILERDQSVLATATFYIKDGTYGHNHEGVPSGKHYRDVVVDDDRSFNSWYKFYCIESKTTSCALDIKNTNHYKYDGKRPKHAQNTCSDSGFPLRTIDVRSSVVFDFRKLITKNEPHTNLPHGYRNEDNAVCRVISTGRFIIEEISVDDMSISNP